MRPKSAITSKPLNIYPQVINDSHKSKIQDQDRKNFIRQAQQIQHKNQDQIQKLKQENQKLKAIKDHHIKSKAQISQNPLNHPLTTNQDFKSTSSTTDQNYLRRLLDKEKHKTKLKKNNLLTLQGKLKQVESNKLGYIEESPLMRNIRILQNQLDKVMIKYNEAQSIQHTYDSVVKRLKEERVGYDSQLAAVEASLKGKEHDFQELLLLAHDATHAKQGAYAQLKRFQQRRVTVQQMRQKYLHEKKQQVNSDIQLQPQHHATQSQSKNLQSKLLNSSNANNYRQNDNYLKYSELEDYEDAFRRLKQVTGVIDPNEIIQKFKTQGLTTTSLETLKESYKNKIQTLKKLKEDFKTKLQNQKFINQTIPSQKKRMDQIESEKATLTNQLQRITLKSKRLSCQLINVKAGITHLREQTSFYKKQGDQAQSLQDELKNINQKLRRMYDAVKNDQNYARDYCKANTNLIKEMLNQNNLGQIKNYNQSDGQSNG